MEHESLRDKLELMDLNQVDGLQWDKERAWTRLNGQLQSTNPKKDITWYSGIAASLVFLILSLSGYIMLNHFGSSKRDGGFYKKQLSSNSITIKEQVCAEECESTEPYNIPEEPLKKALYTAPVFARTIHDTPKQDSTVVVSPNIAQKAKPIYENPSEQGVDFNRSEVKEVAEDIYITKETIAERSYRTEGILSSTPLARKKYKFPIKLFQRKNKSRSSSDKSIPALTLFASK